MISHGGTSTVGTKHLVFHPILQVSDTAYETLFMTSWYEAGMLQMFHLTKCLPHPYLEIESTKMPQNALSQYTRYRYIPRQHWQTVGGLAFQAVLE